jgi:arylsulfatase A-like enzyme
VRRLLPVAAAAALVAIAAACVSSPRAADEGRHLVIVTIDGLRPEFYLDPAYRAPALRELLGRGSHARAAEPVFPSVTYPDHATIVTGVRPAAHGVPFNQVFETTGQRGRWYEEAADLRAPPLWEWARAAGLTTAAVSWPSTLGARIDLLVPERDYHARADALEALRAATTPGLFERTRVAPRAEMFRDVTQWDTFLASTAAALVREGRPRLLLLHLVQTDHFQHREGRDGAGVKKAVARIDGHVSDVLAALRDAGLTARTTVIVTGDHGFQDVEHLVLPNETLARAGLRGCPRAGEGWRATVHVSGGSGAVFVSPPGDAETARDAETALRAAAEGRYAIVGRAALDELGAMPGAAFALEAAPGWAIAGSCGRGLTASGSGGTHGYLPSRSTMATGFIAAGAGVRAGVALDRIRLVDVAPTAARLLGIRTPVVEGRVLTELMADRRDR